MEAIVSVLDRPQSYVATRETVPLALTTRLLDFWFIGGASIVIWIAMFVGQFFRSESWAIDHHFQNLAGIFSALSLVVNYPHFIISYKYAYGRGLRFIFNHWFCLIFVPASLVALFSTAYLKFDLPMTGSVAIASLNSFFDFVGLGIHLNAMNLGTAVLSLSAWLMFLTVGWHYSKQVFGTMLVYSAYEKYPISKIQRRVLKFNLLGLCWLNYFFNIRMVDTYSRFMSAYSLNAQFIEVSISQNLILILNLATFASSAAVFYFLFYKNYRDHKIIPGANIVVPWVAFQIWTFPFFRQTEFLLWVIPFFHSLQYLPFAYKMEKSAAKKDPRASNLRISIQVFVLLLIGYLAFELVPNTLDNKFGPSYAYGQSWFFYTCAYTFINIHHFFMDSVTWRFSSKEVRAGLLSK